MKGTREFIFTFGCGQFYVINAKSPQKAREEMSRRFGGKQPVQYNSREKAGVSKYRLKEVK